MALGMTVMLSWLTSSSRLKHHSSFWVNCHEIWFIYPWLWWSLDFYLASPAGQSFHLWKTSQKLDGLAQNIWLALPWGWHMWYWVKFLNNYLVDSNKTCPKSFHSPQHEPQIFIHHFVKFNLSNSCSSFLPDTWKGTNLPISLRCYLCLT